MALTQAIAEARRQTATREHRQRQHRAELRLEEIVAVAGIADGYEAIDTADDRTMEQHFARLYRTALTQQMRDLIVAAFIDWQRFDRKVDAHVRGETDQAVSLLKVHNPAFIEGVYVPDGSDLSA